MVRRPPCISQCGSRCIEALDLTDDDRAERNGKGTESVLRRVIRSAQPFDQIRAHKLRIGAKLMDPKCCKIDAVIIEQGMTRRMVELCAQDIAVNGRIQCREHSSAPFRVIRVSGMINSDTVQPFGDCPEGAPACNMPTPEIVCFFQAAASDESLRQFWPDEKDKRHIHIFRNSAGDLHCRHRQGGQGQKAHSGHLLCKACRDPGKPVPLSCGQSFHLMRMTRCSHGLQGAHPQQGLIEEKDQINSGAATRSIQTGNSAKPGNAADAHPPEMVEIQSACRPQLFDPSEKLRGQARIKQLGRAAVQRSDSAGREIFGHDNKYPCDPGPRLLQVINALPVLLLEVAE